MSSTESGYLDGNLHVKELNLLQSTVIVSLFVKRECRNTPVTPEVPSRVFSGDSQVQGLKEELE